MPITALHPAPYNPRQISERALAALTASISRWGLVENIVFNLRSGVVISGHQRLKALHGMGATEAMVAIVDVDPIEEKAMNITLNNPAVQGEFTPALEGLLAEPEPAFPAFEAMAMDELEAPFDVTAEAEEFAAPAPPDNPTARRGDVWVLGRHRLMCGDSASTEDLDRLLAGAKIHLLNTDPPYNVKVEPRSNNAIAAGNSSFSKAAHKGRTHHQALDLARHPEKNQPTGKMRAKDRPLENDFVSDDAFEGMLLAWFGNAARAMVAGAGYYIWGGYANVANYPPALRAVKFYFSQTIIWVKEHPVLTRKDFMGNHEWCFYGWKEGAAHRWFGPNNVTDVWQVKKVSPQAMVHLTEKPVELAFRAITYSTKPGENVLDLFGGSGSTLMGAEQTDRRAFLMELDPAYTDVILQRFWDATKVEPVLEATGQTFGAVRSARAAEPPVATEEKA